MKITTLFLFILLMQVSASGYAQKKQVSLNLKNVSVEQLIDVIKKQSGYKFVYRADLFDEVEAINLKADNKAIDEILNEVFSSNGFEYEMVDDMIIVRKAPEVNSVPKQDEKKITITGMVKDDKGEPIPGANIILKDGTGGTISAIDGRFVLDIYDTNTSLIISFIGMETQEIEIGDQTTFEIILIEDVNALGEVIVTGIVERKKESFTGAVQSFTQEQLVSVGNLNIVESLKTLDPSFVIQENNELGSNPNILPHIEVRGKTSISTDNLGDEFSSNPNQPLFILDGFETTLRTIVDLDMNRVASITVLKDGASTALYGAKAANGVVVVETIKATGGDLQVVYTASLRVEIPDLTDYNLMNSHEKLEYELLAGEWGTPGEESNYQYAKNKQYNAILAELARGVDTYWLNEPLQVGTSLGNSLQISGGEGPISYGVGLNYKKLNGVMIGSDRATYGADIRLAYRKGKLNISNQLYINGADANESPYGSFSDYTKANPYFRKTDADGLYPKFLDIEDYFGNKVPNPLYNASLNSIDNTKNLGLINNLQAIWSLSSNFRLQSALQLSKSTSTVETFLPPEHTSFATTSIFEKGSYGNKRVEQFSYKLNVMATYARVFNEKHRLTTNLRAEAEETEDKMLGIAAVGYPNGTNGNPAFAFSYKPDSNPNTARKTYRRVNLLASANYAFDNTYLLDATYRIDGSTVFGSNEKYSPFWALGIGWNLHNELNLNPNKVSMLKLRANIGTTGNQGFANLASVSIYGYNTGTNIFGPTIDMETLANADLEWQTTVQSSVGIDLSMWNNRLNTTFNAYDKNTDPLVVLVNLPSSTGVSSYPMNVGNLRTQGVEAIVSFAPIYNIQDQIVWNLGLTGSAIKSEYDGFGNALKSLDDNAIELQSLIRYRDGYSPDDLWAVRSLGIDPGNGQEVFLTKDGQTTYDYNIEDEQVVGNRRPKVEGVISSNLRIKNFTFGVNLRYRLGGDALNTALFNKVENISELDRLDNYDKRVVNDRWRNEGDVTRFKSISNFESTPISSRFIQKENVLIGESINVGYDLKNKAWMGKIGLNTVRLNAYMNDIFRISTIKTERGIDYPFARAVSFNLTAYF